MKAFQYRLLAFTASLAFAPALSALAQQAPAAATPEELHSVIASNGSPEFLQLAQSVVGLWLFESQRQIDPSGKITSEVTDSSLIKSNGNQPQGVKEVFGSDALEFAGPQIGEDELTWEYAVTYGYGEQKFRHPVMPSETSPDQLTINLSLFTPDDYESGLIAAQSGVRGLWSQDFAASLEDGGATLVLTEPMRDSKLVGSKIVYRYRRTE